GCIIIGCSPLYVPKHMFRLGTIADINVHLDISHIATNTLDLTLIHPDGTRVVLSSGNGGVDFTGTIFDDEAGTSISSGTAPFIGSFQPEESLSTLDGKSVWGNWQLEIAGGSVLPGTLTGWSLEIVRE
ncbi:MAG: proprotein convertase P-domain-containing protein, partial [Chrysiogenetes bacterium]|nr:proprotein convertase P-domain-containing protein [Chrysiogenetes bacterium]